MLKKQSMSENTANFGVLSSNSFQHLTKQGFMVMFSYVFSTFDCQKVVLEWVKSVREHILR